jgi:hypothetical protein
MAGVEGRPLDDMRFVPLQKGKDEEDDDEEEEKEEEAKKVRGSLQVKVKEGTFDDSWRGADCQYNRGTHEFSSTDRKGEQQRLANCWAVDVPNSFGRKQHRFDVASTHSTPVALAAADESEKQRWLAALPTKVHLKMHICKLRSTNKHTVHSIIQHELTRTKYTVWVCTTARFNTPALLSLRTYHVYIYMIRR